MPPSTARQEWATMWPLPLVCMLAITGSAMFAYAGGVYMESVTTEFRWSRAQYSSAFMLMMISGLFLGPAAGWLIDRIGPRKVALGGIIPFAISISLFGLVRGSLWQWYGLCLLLAVFQAAISQIVWVKAIVGRFNHSRGLALAVTLAGLGLGSFIWPLLAAICIAAVGWRGAFPAMAALYVTIALPLVFLFFHGAPTSARSPGNGVARPSISADLKTPTFVGLAVAAGLFAASSYGLSMHFAPLLKANGFDLKAAAGIAGLIGVFSVMGRLATGLLLDRFSTRLVAIFAFLLPLGTVASLFLFPGTLSGAVVAVAFLGFASGAELDVVTFIVARRFSQEVFGAIYAAIMSIISVCASIGPVVAGAVYDASKSYTLWLEIVGPLVVASATIIACIPLYGRDKELTRG